MMSSANPVFTILSCIALSQGCYGNVVSGSGSGAAGQTETSAAASSAAPDSLGASTNATDGATTIMTTFHPTGNVSEPMDPSMTSETNPSTGNTPDPITTTGDAPEEAGCSYPDDPWARTVFVTSGIFDSSLTPENWKWNTGEDGAMRGDALCQCVAANAHLPGHFAAWLSQGEPFKNGSIKNFIEGHHPDVKQWNFVDSKGNCIASSWDNFTDGSLDTPIQLNEHGNVLADGLVDLTWTGSTAEGWATGYSCKDWTGSGVVTVGNLHRSDSEWSATNPCPNLFGLILEDCIISVCDTPRHLYCIQLSKTPIQPSMLHSSCPVAQGS